VRTARPSTDHSLEAVSEPSEARRLEEILRASGVRTVEDRKREGLAGFPVRLQLRDGSELVLDLPEPALLSALDPAQAGVALLDALGYARSLWGLAARSPCLGAKRSALTTEIGPLVQGALQGTPGSLHLDGLRYHAAPLDWGGEREALVLVTNAAAEQSALALADRHRMTAEALRRLSQAIAMNPSVEAMAKAAVFELASVAELACALLWVRTETPGEYALEGAMGANRQACRALERLHVPGGPCCAAELVAETRRSLFVPSVAEHLLTRDLEARLCYLSPGPASLHPLEAGGELLGVLELIGRADDSSMAVRRQLFAMLAEQLALGLHGALVRRSLEQAATRDPLTGLLNHRALHEELLGRISQAERSGKPLGMLMIDVDRFRNFNEEEGHAAGDQVLRQVADAIRSVLRPYDVVGRYGGEEFAVLLPDADPARCASIAERVRQAVALVRHATSTGRPRGVTVSIGCASIPHNGDDAAMLLRAADAALYRAKRAGRNRVETFQGVADREAPREAVPLDAVWAWVAEERRAESERLLATLDDLMPQLKASLGLSRSQQQILRSLAVALPEYRAAVARRDAARLEAMRRAEEFRLLLPSLETWDARADAPPEEGQAPPLLARVLAVVESVANDDGRSLREDPGRYDPDVLRALRGDRDAA